MEIILFEDVVVSLELILAIIELAVLVIVLVHMKKMEEHSGV